MLIHACIYVRRYYIRLRQQIEGLAGSPALVKLSAFFYNITANCLPFVYTYIINESSARASACNVSPRLLKIIYKWHWGASPYANYPLHIIQGNWVTYPHRFSPLRFSFLRALPRPTSSRTLARHLYASTQGSTRQNTRAIVRRLPTYRHVCICTYKET